MNYKFCVKCGHKISADAMFCPHCGTQQPGDTQNNQGYNQQPSNNFHSNDMSNNYRSQQPDFNNYRPRNDYAPRQNPQGSFMNTINGYNQRLYNYARTRHSPFVGALADFFHNYANFSGRATRSQYWYMALWHIIIWLIIIFLCFILIGIPIAIIVGIGEIIPFLSLMVRRLRDAGMENGFIIALLVLNFIPFINFVSGIITFVYTLMPSVQHPMPMNRPPYPPNQGEYQGRY